MLSTNSEHRKPNFCPLMHLSQGEFEPPWKMLSLEAPHSHGASRSHWYGCCWTEHLCGLRRGLGAWELGTTWALAL